METSLAGKSAVVTGSTSGVGRGIAAALAAQGCNVMLNGFGDPADIETLILELRELGDVEVSYHGADLAQPAQVAELMRSAAELHGPVDILVNNAGFQFVAPIEEFPEEKWDGILAVNLSACFHTTKAALPGMKAKKWGRIINIASVHGLFASPFKSAYVTAKHGLVGLTKVTALEVARDGITCNAICPGYVHTPIVDKQIEEQSRVTGIPRDRVVEEVILVKHPNRRFVEIDEIASMVLFMCGPGGASMTGSALTMDGGWSAI